MAWPGALGTSRDLSVEQAAKVDEIQKKTRDAVRPVREELNHEERALRRAKLANDAEAIAKQEGAVKPLRGKLAGIFENESEQIRAFPTDGQKTEYEEFLKIRDEMAGSSRDVKEFQ